MDNLKKDVLRKLEDAVSRNLVDEEVMPLLSSFNYIDEVVTTSSCSGRYQLISVPRTGDKVSSDIVGKWHRTVHVEELLGAIDQWDGTGELSTRLRPGAAGP